MRINKFLSDAGYCSRREADRLIEAGRITIDDRPAVPGEQVFPGQSVCADGRKIQPEEEKVLLLFHKPRGIVCTAEKRERDNIVRFVDYPIRVYPVGRLDKDSRGLILLTNRGELVNPLMKASGHHEKEYQVRVNRMVTGDFLKRMESGVYLPELSVTTRRCRVKKTGADTFSIVLTQGLNRQIRRMCTQLGYRAEDILRTRICNLRLGDLKEGAYRKIRPEEEASLLSLLGISPVNCRSIDEGRTASPMGKAGTDTEKHDREGIGYAGGETNP